jgi:hypothetical protein
LTEDEIAADEREKPCEVLEHNNATDELSDLLG